MTQKRHIPTSLAVVSFLFLFLGILSAVEIIGEATKGSLQLDFGVLGIGIFFGLRRFSPGWRRCALVFIWLGMITLAVFFVYGFVGHGPAFIKVFGQRHADIPVIWVSVVAAVFFPLEFWMYRVLTRPKIRILFQVDSPTPAA